MVKRRLDSDYCRAYVKPHDDEYRDPLSNSPLSPAQRKRGQVDNALEEGE